MRVHTLPEFIKEWELRGCPKFIGDTDTWNTSFVSQLLNDFAIPSGGTEFMGILRNDYTDWNEYMILYRIPKDSQGAEYLGSMISVLGKMITRLRCVGYDFGIQEVDPARPDGYYFLFYGLEEKDKE